MKVEDIQKDCLKEESRETKYQLKVSDYQNILFTIYLTKGCLPPDCKIGQVLRINKLLNNSQLEGSLQTNCMVIPVGTQVHQKFINKVSMVYHGLNDIILG